MKKFVQAASVVALAVASASASAGWGAHCVDPGQQKAMVEQQQAAAKQYQAQFQAMAEQRAKAMEEMMKAQQGSAFQAAPLPGSGAMDPFFGQAGPMRDFPAMPERPSFGEMPPMHDFPAMPERPRFGKMPQMPDFPGMPEAPKFGEMPAMPEMPAGFERGLPPVPPVLGHRGRALEAYRAQRMEESKARHDKAMTELDARRRGLVQRVSARRFGPPPMWYGPMAAPVAPTAAQPAPAAAPAVEAPAAPAAAVPAAN